MRYKAWGETHFTSGSTLTTFRFTGQRQEEQLGLYFYNARWHDPALGRFIQADSIIPDAGNSSDWDRYAYVRNNPVRYIDPSGNRVCDDDSNGGCVTWTVSFVLKAFGISMSSGTQKQRWNQAEAAMIAGINMYNLIGGSPEKAFNLTYGNPTIEIRSREKVTWDPDEDGFCETVGYTITCVPHTSHSTALHEFSHVFDNHV